MPIIEFSEDDFLRDKIVEPAWYTVSVNNIGEAPSKDGNSTNYPVNSVIIRNADNGSEEFKGVPIYWNFNSKMKGAVTGFLAALGVEAKPKMRVELGNAVGKLVDVFIETGEWQGRLKNEVNHKYRKTRD